MLADAFVALLAAHFLGDYVGQTDRQSARKAGWTEGEDGPCPGRHHHGWGANLAHVATHVLVSAGLLLAVALAVPGFRPEPAAALAALGWVGATHSVIDRRWPVRWWMEHTGSSGFVAVGMPLVDQAMHIGLGLFPGALLLAALSL